MRGYRYYMNDSIVLKYDDIRVTKVEEVDHLDLSDIKPEAVALYSIP